VKILLTVRMQPTATPLNYSVKKHKELCTLDT